MGLRYRKSINLGGGFRVNFSKSGVGYSWGGKGYRVTKKAGGGVRKTYSIPGTGLSWVDDSSGRKKKATGNSANNNFSQPVVQNTGNLLYQAEEANVKQLVTENTQDFLDAIKKYSGIRTLLIWVTIISLLLTPGTPFFIVLFFAGIAGVIYLSATKKISVEYEFDEYGKRRIQMMDQAMGMLINNRSIWQVNTIQANASRKTNAGASQSVGRKIVKFQKKKPFFLKTDATCYHIKLLRDNVFILPDRLIIKGKKGWGAVDYSELHMGVGNVVFIESGAVPKDAQIVGHTWQYVNKNGTADKRFKNNRQLPKCNYGSIEFKSDTGLDIILYISNIGNAQQFSSIVKVMIEEAQQARLLAAQEPALTQDESESYEFDNSEDFQEINSYSEVKPEASDMDVVKNTGNPSNMMDYVPIDVSESERIVLEAFWNGLIENGLPTVCKCRRIGDGTIEVNYKGSNVGAVSLRDGNLSISYPMGNSGKIKTVDGTVEELAEKTSNWLRYIINYL